MSILKIQFARISGLMSYINKENGANLEMKSMGNIVNQNRFDINDGLTWAY